LKISIRRDPTAIRGGGGKGIAPFEYLHPYGVWIRLKKKPKKVGGIKIVASPRRIRF